jgi:ribosome-binding protein aMBF1 (putative translation factor)
MQIIKVLLTKTDKTLIENKLLEKEIQKQQLADLLFIKPFTLSKILNGRQVVSIDFLKKIEKILEINLKVENYGNYFNKRK